MILHSRKCNITIVFGIFHVISKGISHDILACIWAKWYAFLPYGTFFFKITENFNLRYLNMLNMTTDYNMV